MHSTFTKKNEDLCFLPFSLNNVNPTVVSEAGDTKKPEEQYPFGGVRIWEHHCPVARVLVMVRRSFSMEEGGLFLKVEMGLAPTGST